MPATCVSPCPAPRAELLHKFNSTDPRTTQPTYPSFLTQIQAEARQNIRRLRTHPSLAIWAGNNEDYQIQEQEGLEYDYDGDKDPQHWLKTTFPARYIYEYLLPKIVEEESPGAVYHPSSPWGDGKKTWDGTVGDIHQWNGTFLSRVLVLSRSRRPTGQP